MHTDQTAHPLFGASFGDASRHGRGAGLAPLGEGWSAYVPNPSWPGMAAVQQSAFGQAHSASNPFPEVFLPRPIPFNPSDPAWPGMTAVQTTAFPGGGAVTGLMPVQQRAFFPLSAVPNPLDEKTIHAQLPDGRRVRAQVHRVYRTPKTQMLTSRDTVIQNPKAQYTSVWLPASWDEQRPPGAGKWVQLSGTSALGLLHTVGAKPRVVTVVEFGNGMDGRPTALVRYQKAVGNPVAVRRTVATRSRLPGGSGSIKAPITTEGDWCKWFPMSAPCQGTVKAKCAPGWEPYPGDPSKGCIPMNPTDARSVASHRRMADRARLATRNPTVWERARATLRGLTSGRKRVVIDTEGVSIR